MREKIIFKLPGYYTSGRSVFYNPAVNITRTDGKTTQEYFKTVRKAFQADQTAGAAELIDHQNTNELEFKVPPGGTRSIFRIYKTTIDTWRKDYNGKYVFAFEVSEITGPTLANFGVLINGGGMIYTDKITFEITEKGHYYIPIDPSTIPTGGYISFGYGYSTSIANPNSSTSSIKIKNAYIVECDYDDKFPSYFSTATSIKNFTYGNKAKFADGTVATKILVRKYTPIAGDRIFDDSKRFNIVGAGDSFSSDYYEYPSLLCKDYNYNIIDFHGIGGDRLVSHIVPSIFNYFVKHGESNIDCVLLNGGTNDLSIIHLEEMKDAVKKLYKHCKAFNIKVCIVNVSPRNDYNGTNNNYNYVSWQGATETYSHREKIKLYNKFLDEYSSERPDLRVVNIYKIIEDPNTPDTANTTLVETDGLHPNVAGQLLIGKACADALEILFLQDDEPLLCAFDHEKFTMKNGYITIR